MNVFFYVGLEQTAPRVYKRIQAAMESSSLTTAATTTTATATTADSSLSVATKSNPIISIKKVSSADDQSNQPKPQPPQLSSTAGNVKTSATINKPSLSSSSTIGSAKASSIKSSLGKSSQEKENNTSGGKQQSSSNKKEEEDENLEDLSLTFDAAKDSLAELGIENWGLLSLFNNYEYNVYIIYYTIL